MSNLWTPDRDVDVSRERHVENCSPQEMELFANMHRFAYRHGIGMHCMKCDHPFQGFNSETGATWSVRCNCREIKATVRAGIVVP